MALNLTQGSMIEYENILYGNMSPKMAADYLREGRISVRSFSDTLKYMYPHDDLLQRLKAFYRENLPMERSDSVNRKIQNWLKERNHPTNREDYFRIAFALDLTEPQLNFLLGLCTDYAIQYRDEREILLTWFLRNGYRYDEALRFLDTLPLPGHRFDASSAVKPADSPIFAAIYENLSQERRDAVHIKTNERLVQGYTEVSRITHEIRNDFQMARDLEDLRSCYLRNLDRFGQMHLRSYYYLLQYLKQLVHPSSFPGESETDYSIETVMKTYLTLHMPTGRSLDKYSLVQKLIKHNWPNLTYLRRILVQAEDVPRKLLMLLYVVTENNGIRNEYSELDEEYVSLEERVEDHWWTMNALLTECGMATLDLRNAFDWLILYAVSSDGEESMSSRLEGVIEELYKDVK